MASPSDNPIAPFTLNISPKQRESVVELARASLLSLKSIHKAGPLPSSAGAQDNYSDGLDSQTVETLCEYFVNDYDWRRHEAEFNKMGQQYLLRIDDVPGEDTPLKIHFVHAVSPFCSFIGSLQLDPTDEFRPHLVQTPFHLF